MDDRASRWVFPLLVVALTGAGLGLVSLGGNHEPALVPETPQVHDAGYLAWSEADCARGCAAIGWLFAQMPCARSAICSPEDGGLACVLREDRSLRCACPGFNLVDVYQPDAKAQAGILVSNDERRFIFTLGFRLEMARLDGPGSGLTLWSGDGGIHELTVPLVIPLGADETPLELGFSRIEEGLGTLCPVPEASRLGIPVDPASLLPRSARIEDPLARARGMIAAAVWGSEPVSATAGVPEIESQDIQSAELVGFVKARMKSIETCARRERKRHPSFAGKIVVRFVVGENGRVREVEIDENTTATDDLANCIRSTIKVWTTPFHPLHDVPVSYPFLFAPPG